MIRALHGLLWQIDTPSVYKLLSAFDDNDSGASVRVCYGDTRSWWLVYCQPNRLPIYREFKTRDDAMAMVASRKGVA